MPQSGFHYTRKLTELTLLFEISRTLDKSLDLDEAIVPVLKLLKEHLGLLHGTVTLLNRQTGLITVEAAHEVREDNRRRAVYSPGEGITGRVVQTGEAMIIPDIHTSRDFLNKTGIHHDVEGDYPVSFVCVPIKTGKDIMGTLSADRVCGSKGPFEDERSSGSLDKSLEEDRRLLSIVASMIAQAVKLRRSIIEERNRLIDENSRLKHELEQRFKPKNIIGTSAAMQEVFYLLGQVAASEATVLIRGESGTGKELIAHAIHYNSPRAEGPFIKVNCSALPETVIESELFGHEKGAFTGAVQTRKGRFEVAHGGTIFLDEIGDLSLPMQVKILRVLQEREFERVGGNRTQRTNVRIVTATNRNLEEMIEGNDFREDLYYRLAVFPIHIPPLRERKSDITLLADHFAEKYSKKNNKQIYRISTPAIELLSIYHWPGNVRELENCIERAVLLSTDGVIHGHHLPPTLQSAESTGTSLRGGLNEELEKVEKELILDALKSSKGNAADAARSLGISERIIGLRIKKYGINPGRFRH
ncbi:MAG: sigma 54-interacting transcriptional regulator [Sediminispirochaetaceae bacterium]